MKTYIALILAAALFPACSNKQSSESTNGKALEQTTIVWQNIVHSTRQPIEKGKTYEDTTSIDPATAKAECTLKEVIFKDGTSKLLKGAT